MDEIVKNSEFWKSEIKETQKYMASLVHGELAGVKSTKSADDNISFQDAKQELEKCRIYISYCEDELKKALEEESGEKQNKSILYFKREYGY